MRDELESLVNRFLPGMGLRPLYYTAIATWAMVIYQYHGGQAHAPRWFTAYSEQLFGLELPEFHQHMWAHSVAIMVLMIAPIGLAYALDGMTLKDLGLDIKGAHKELGAVLLLWLFMIPLVFWVKEFPSFARIYPRLSASKNDAQLFFLFEGLYFFKWMAWEFFFRGFVLFSLRKDMANRAILVSTVGFALMHYGKAELEMASAVIAGPVLCYLAIRSRSIWPGVLLHWLVASTMDFANCDFWR